MRRTLLIVLTVTLFLPLCASAMDVRVGVDNNPPLTFVDKQGRADGLFPELLKQIGKKHDWSLATVPCAWKQCLELLDNGQIDILPAIAYTEQRAQKYTFATETVFTAWGQIYQRPGTGLDSILQLDGLKLAVLSEDVYLAGDQGLKQVARNFDIDITYVEVASNREAFEKLKQAEVDAAMVGRIYGIKHRQDFGLLPAPIMIKPIQVRPAFSKTAPAQIRQQFDQTLSEWKKSPGSSYFSLLEKWLGDKLAATLPTPLKILLPALAALLALLLLATAWTRKQVRVKTLQLEEKNRQLEDELIERQQVEAELRERQQQYRVLFEETQSIMLLLDPETTEIVDANPAACSFYQFAREELRGLQISQLNELSHDEIQEKIEQIEAGDLQQFELVHILSSGEKRHVEIQSSPMVVEGRTLICSIVRDISKRKLAEQKIEERNVFLQSVIDGVSDPLMVISFDYRVLQMNKAASENFAAPQDGDETLLCHQVSHASMVPCSGDEHPCPIKEIQQTGNPVRVIHNHLIDEEQRVIELSASPLFDADGQPYAVIEVARDITERQQIDELLRENEKRLHHLAHHDPLTELPNRLLFEDRLKQALSKARRSRKQVALFFLDLDHFKEVNDNLGHDQGDRLLVDIANRLRGCIRESDTVARLGGDEFLVLLEEVESIERIEMMAERICEELAHELNRDGYYQRISASIGISIYPEDGNSGHELLTAADQAMYRVKSQGKANFQFYSTPQGHLNFD